jgi:hypothetical protein
VDAYAIAVACDIRVPTRSGRDFQTHFFILVYKKRLLCDDDGSATIFPGRATPANVVRVTKIEIVGATNYSLCSKLLLGSGRKFARRTIASY